MTSSHPTPVPCQCFARLAGALDRRSAPRLALLFFGAILARGRRTVTTSIRAAKLSVHFRPCYTAIAAAGKRADRIVWRPVVDLVTPLIVAGERLTFALDDTPTQSYGPSLQRRGHPSQHDTRSVRIAPRLRPWLCCPGPTRHPPNLGHDRAAAAVAFDLYGGKATKRYKLFLATWRPAGGVIRVVLVDEPTGWRAFFCTDPSATAEEILAAVANRFSLEISFRDCKEIVGAGQKQVRFLWTNIGAFQICLWTFTLTEVWAWGGDEDELMDRMDSPWDSLVRRPSHADKRRAWRRKLLGEEFLAVLRPGASEAEIQAAADRLLNLVA